MVTFGLDGGIAVADVAAAVTNAKVKLACIREYYASKRMKSINENKWRDSGRISLNPSNEPLWRNGRDDGRVKRVAC